jgi:hypothetical protein
MIEKRSQSMNCIVARLYDSGSVRHNFGEIARLKNEIGVESGLRKAEHSDSLSKMKYIRVDTKPSCFSSVKRASIRDFLYLKKRILLTKLRLLDKKEHFKELQEDLSFEEKQLNMRIIDLLESKDLLRKNFEDQKKGVEILAHEVESNNELKHSRNSILLHIKDKVGQKEGEIKAIDRKIEEFREYGTFIISIFQHFGREFNEIELIQNVKTIKQYKSKKSNIYNQRNNTENHNDNLNDLAYKENFFLTSKPEPIKEQEVSPSFSVSQMCDDFFEMLNTIENQNFQLHEDLQLQESNLIEIDSRNRL